MKKLAVLFIIPLMFGSLFLGCAPTEGAQPPGESQEQTEPSEP